ncbi:MAG TPA: DUF2478 domain-containing protein [Telmatospirillum sp.]|nr:DUF2478 domain-containing protein [Telmatospirillum sp.]
MSSTDELPPIGVILHERADGSEELLMDFVSALRAEGWDVGGLAQKSVKTSSHHNRMELIDIRTGSAFSISQNLGVGSDACCVDPAGLAAASQVLRREIEQGVALLVISKFAKAECEGKGLLPETFEAISKGIPVLTTLATRHKPQWDEIIGDAGEMLAPRMEILRQWWNRVNSLVCQT